MLIVLLSIGILFGSFNVQSAKASGTIYIRADGSVDPQSSPISSTDNITYVLTDNIASCLVVERNDTIIDGASKTLTGTGVATATGIAISNGFNVTIENVNIVHVYGYGVSLGNSSKCSVHSNNITDNYMGIYLYGSQDNTLSNNVVTGSNTGVLLDYSSHNNNVTGNDVMNSGYGIWLTSSSSDNDISANNITGSVLYGVLLQGCSGNRIHGNNTLRDNNFGIMLYSSSQNGIRQNTLVQNDNFSIVLSFSSNNNTIIGNDIIDNAGGIGMISCYGNFLHHNNLRGNGEQAHVESSSNSWDDGSEGNYWSNYLSRYPNASEIDSSGIGDTAYYIDANNIDHYPLMAPIVIPEFPSFLILSLIMIVTLPAVIAHRRRKVRCEAKTSGTH